MVNNMKEVAYDAYCCKCVYRNRFENEDPCYDCLATPVNEHSRKPVNYSEDPNVKGDKRP